MRPLILIACLIVPSSAVAEPLLYTYTGEVFTFATGQYAARAPQIVGSFLLDDTFVAESTIFVDVMGGVLGYSFTDGHQTFTHENSTAQINIGFNPDGLPLVPGGTGLAGRWSFLLTSETGGIRAIFSNNEFRSTAWIGASAPAGLHLCHDGWQCYDDPAITSAIIDGQLSSDQFPGGPGFWTVETAVQPVPEPATWLVLALGGAALLRRR